MLRQAAATALALVVVVTPAAHSSDGGTGVGTPGCKGATMYVKVCAHESGSIPETGGSASNGVTGASVTDNSDEPKCTYEKADPQPPANNLAWGDHKPGDGAIYRVVCPATGRFGVVWLSNGTPAQPQIDPEVVARMAVDQMKLIGPDIASPLTAGKYLVGVPVWMWVHQSPSTFGPNTASATAGGVTVTATAKVSKIVWKMGDGSTVTCNGPGTPYKASYGKQDSPTCGHTYTRTSASRSGGTYALTATSTWTVDWQVSGSGELGQLTEIRQSQEQVAIGELQVVG